MQPFRRSQGCRRMVPSPFQIANDGEGQGGALVGLHLGPGVISLIGQFNDSATFLHGLPASQVEHVHLSGSGEGLHFQEYIPTPQSDSQSPMEGVLGSLIVTSHAAQIPAAS